jgi:hypothetical protein
LLQRKTYISLPGDRVSILATLFSKTALHARRRVMFGTH